MSTNNAVQRTAPRTVIPTTPDFNRPVLKRSIALQSFHAQNVFNYAYEDTERALYVIAALQGMGAPDLAEAAGNSATAKMEEYKGNLEKEKDRLQKLMADNGITDLATFRRPQEVVVEITSPRANAYLSVITLFDEIAAMIFTLWLVGIFNDQQKENALKAMSKQVASGRATFSLLSFRAFRAWQNRNRAHAKGESIVPGNKPRGRKKGDALPDEITAQPEVSEEDAVAAIAEATGKAYTPKTLAEQEPLTTVRDEPNQQATGLVSEVAE